MLIGQFKSGAKNVYPHWSKQNNKMAPNMNAITATALLSIVIQQARFLFFNILVIFFVRSA